MKCPPDVTPLIPPHVESADRPPTASRILQRAAVGLVQLAEAYVYAQELERDGWEFALDVEILRRSGMTDSDLRWLICKGFLEHGRELSLTGDHNRLVRPTPSLALHGRSCFILSKQGMAFARRALEGTKTRNMHPGSDFSEPRPNATQPVWDHHRQELRLGGLLIKQYKVPAPNQETILAAFEEEKWPPRIDDPLPPQPSQDCKRRLHDTINSLNRNQKQSLVRFFGDGTGLGVCWQLVVPPALPTAPAATLPVAGLDGSPPRAKT